MSATVVRDHDNKRLIVSRSVSGPPDLVWACWTEAAHLQQWWGPMGWRTDVFELDVRVGGVWRYRLRPDREHEIEEEHWGRAVYDEVWSPEALTFRDGTSGPDGEPVPDTEMPTRVAISAIEAGRCDVVITVGFPSVVALEEAEALGMITGFTETLQRLDEHISATPTEGMQQ